MMHPALAETIQRKKALRRTALLITCARLDMFTSMDAYLGVNRDIRVWCENPPTWWYEKFRPHDAPNESTVGNILRQWVNDGLLSRTRRPGCAYIYYWNEE